MTLQISGEAHLFYLFYVQSGQNSQKKKIHHVVGGFILKHGGVSSLAQFTVWPPSLEEVFSAHNRLSNWNM